MSLFTQYRIARNLLEVYKTDEENWEPYTPRMSYDDDGTSSTDEEDETEEDDEEEEEEEENDEGFSLHQGEILEKYYYQNLYSTEAQYDVFCMFLLRRYLRLQKIIKKFRILFSLRTYPHIPQKK